MGRLSIKVVPGSSRDEVVTAKVVAVAGMDDEAIRQAFDRTQPENPAA